MDEPTAFGTLIRCRVLGQEGHAVSTGKRKWTFRANEWSSQSGLEWRELDVIEVIHPGVEIPA